MDYFQLLLIFSFLLEIFCNNFEIQNNVLLNDTPGKIFNELTMLECAFSCNQMNSTYANSNVDGKVVMSRGKCHCFKHFNESLVEDNEDWHLLFPLILQPLPDFSEKAVESVYGEWMQWSACKLPCSRTDYQTRERRCNAETTEDCDVSLTTETRKCECYATRVLDASKKYCFTSDPDYTRGLYTPIKLEPINSPVCNSSKAWFFYHEYIKQLFLRDISISGIWVCKKSGQIGRMIGDNACANGHNEFEFTPWNTLWFFGTCYYPVGAEVNENTQYEYEFYKSNACLKNENKIYFDNYTRPETVAVDFYLMNFQPYNLDQFGLIKDTSAANFSGYHADFKFDIYVNATFQVRLRTYFVPPKDGEYFFRMCCGYKCRLYIGSNPGKEGVNNLQPALENVDVLLRTKCSRTSPGIESSGFALEYGRPYYLEALVLGNSVDSYMRVGVATKEHPRFVAYPFLRHYDLRSIGN